MLETIKESRSFHATLPPRAAVPRKVPAGSAQYFGDQDPTDNEEGLEYAKAYTAMQLKALNTAQKAEQQPTSKAPEGSPSSATSDQSFVCNMSAASEPLYGDPGEEDFWK